MSAAVTLFSLLEEPFGPFEDVDILSEELKSTRKDVLGLKSFRMACNNRPIGYAYIICTIYSDSPPGSTKRNLNQEGLCQRVSCSVGSSKSAPFRSSPL